MKKIDFSKATRAFHKVGFTIKKHSPEILMVAGVAGAVTSTVMACKATLKVNDVLEEAKTNIDAIHTVSNDETMTQKYTPEDAKKDLAVVYAQTGVKLVKLYGPAIIIGALSIGSIVGSNHILRKRNVALAAAYATIDGAFKDYRGRVVERFGEKVDRELCYNIKAKEVEERVVDENGNEAIVKSVTNVADYNEPSGYARYFEKYTRDSKGNTIVNQFWDDNNEYNLMFVKNQERYANDLLRSRGRLFLNEVYRMLGIPESQEGQVVGWVYDEDAPHADTYISFGLYNDQLSYSDFVYGNDNGILLDFNVDGNIWKLMK